MAKREQKRIFTQEEIQQIISACILPEHVENWTRMIENLQSKQHMTYQEAFRRVASWHADPSWLPPDVFISLEDDNDGDADDFLPDSIFSDGEEEYDFDFDEDEEGVRKGQCVATSSRVERAGACIELWPKKKVLQAIPVESDKFIHHDFPNVMMVTSHDEFVEKMQRWSRTVVDELNLDAIRDAIKKCPRHPDAIVIDPPINELNIGEDALGEMLMLLKPSNPKLNTFIFVWIDSQNIQLLTKAADKSELLFCDSIVVELFDSKMEPFQVIDSSGMKRTSRMVMLYRTMDLKKDMLAQQMTRDTGYGMARACGKSHGRPGMPPVPHQNAERMLPQKGSQKRVFLEFWPTRMMPLDGWIAIDEKQ